MSEPVLLAPDSVDEVVARLASQNYLCDRRLATALFLALKLQRPLLPHPSPKPLPAYRMPLRARPCSSPPSP